MPRILTVGVFGPNGVGMTEQQIARGLGHAIVSRGHVVLAGGQAPADLAACDSVKDCAMAGAEAAAGAGPGLAWIGVPRSPDPRVPTRSPTGHGLVLQPGYSHARNYVEATLCDVAIALAGGPGTGSEVAFCLAAGRPVVLLGPEWHPRYDLAADREAALAHFREDVAGRVQGTAPEPPWRGQIDAAANRLVAPAMPLPRVEYRPLPVPAAAGDMVDLALGLLDG